MLHAESSTILLMDVDSRTIDFVYKYFYDDRD